MTILWPPAGFVGLRKFELSSGRRYMPADDGSVSTTDAADISELQSEGWSTAKVVEQYDLKKGMQPMTITDTSVLARGRQLAKMRGGSEASDADLRLARRQLEAENPTPIEDRALRAAAEHASLRRRGMHEGMTKTSLMSTHTILDAGHTKVVFGDVSTEHGIIQCSLDRGTATINLHGHDHAMGEIDDTTRMAIYATANRFQEAQNQEEQVQQRLVLAALVNAAMRRDERLSDRVKRNVAHTRYDTGHN